MTVRGWCPGALRPMRSGDGLVVRIRPHAGRLSAEQARALADLSQAHGNGRIDLGTRAHLQLRGVQDAALPVLQSALAGLGLLDRTVGAEARRNILTTPIHATDETLGLVAALEAALADGPDLPPKFGFAVDTGARAVLGAASADIRIERATAGLILRADGMDLGAPVMAAEAPGRAVALAHWFAAHRGAETRMARLIAAGARPPSGATTPPLTGPRLGPGRCAFGLCLALPFGQIAADDLRRIAVAPIRLTPWRSVIVEGAPEVPETVFDHDDPLLRIHACTGAPGCASASVATRALARRLARLLPEGAELHVSGCAKGCAHPGPALTLTGRDGRFDLIPFGPAGAPPARTGLNPDDIPELIRGYLAPPL